MTLFIKSMINFKLTSRFNKRNKQCLCCDFVLELQAEAFYFFKEKNHYY